MSVFISFAPSEDTWADEVATTIGTPVRSYLWAYPQNPTSTISYSMATHPWWQSMLLDALDQVSRRASVEAGASLATAIVWLHDLPVGVPQPSVGIGDDGTVSVEWDRADNHFHVLFEGGTGEVYFLGANGDEFETALGAGEDKIDSALRAIARAA